MLSSNHSGRRAGGFVSQLTRRPSFQSSCMDAAASFLVAAPVFLAAFVESGRLDSWADQLSDNLKLGVMCLAGGDLIMSSLNVLSFVPNMCVDSQKTQAAFDALCALLMVAMIITAVASKSIREDALRVYDGHLGKPMNVLIGQAVSGLLNEAAIGMGACLENAPARVSLPLVGNQGSACAGRLGKTARFLTEATGAGPIARAAARVAGLFKTHYCAGARGQQGNHDTCYALSTTKESLSGTVQPLSPND